MTEEEAREGQTKHIEREFEVGKDESWYANIKRLHDEMLHASLESMRRSRAQYDKLTTDSHMLTTQLMQAAIENANLASKQAIRHAGIEADRLWNVDEVSQLVAKTPVFLDAISAAVAAAIAGSLKPEPAPPAS